MWISLELNRHGNYWKTDILYVLHFTIWVVYRVESVITIWRDNLWFDRPITSHGYWDIYIFGWFNQFVYDLSNTYLDGLYSAVDWNIIAAILSSSDALALDKSAFYRYTKWMESYTQIKSIDGLL